MAGLGEGDYTVRQAAYDLRKLRAKNLVTKAGRSRRYLVPTDATPVRDAWRAYERTLDALVRKRVAA